MSICVFVSDGAFFCYKHVYLSICIRRNIIVWMCTSKALFCSLKNNGSDFSALAVFFIQIVSLVCDAQENMSCFLAARLYESQRPR